MENQSIYYKICNIQILYTPTSLTLPALYQFVCYTVLKEAYWWPFSPRKQGWQFAMASIKILLLWYQPRPAGSISDNNLNLRIKTELVAAWADATASVRHFFLYVAVIPTVTGLVFNAENQIIFGTVCKTLRTLQSVHCTQISKLCFFNKHGVPLSEFMSNINIPCWGWQLCQQAKKSHKCLNLPGLFPLSSHCTQFREKQERKNIIQYVK